MQVNSEENHLYTHKYLKLREPRCKTTLKLVDWVIKCLMASSQQEAVI